MSAENIESSQDPHAAQAELAALKFALSSANIGTWDVKLTSPWKAVWDDRCKELFGVGENKEMDYSRTIDFIHEDDREIVDKSVKAALAGADEGNYNMVYRTISTIDGQPRWVNTIGKAYFDDHGVPVRFAGIAIDATRSMNAQRESVRNQLRLEEAETSLSDAIEIAELGTWSLDLVTNIITYSPRMQEWYGLSSSQIHMEELMQMVDVADRDYARATRKNIDDVRINDLIISEHTIINKKTGQRRIINSVGKKTLNEQGIPVYLRGTSRDVTGQRERVQGLEKEVQVSAEQLAAANEELQATNEELTATNEELEQTNDDLQRSNDELAQYAYVASHDLQEPLRKIRTFASFLQKQRDLAHDSREYLEKIIHSAARMNSLIRDLLDFSSLLDASELMRPVKLEEILLAVLGDFELNIAEKQAEIQVADLPVVEGVRMQINQLFQNLVGNALKFSSGEREPILRIDTREISGSELEKYIPGAFSFTKYYEISVTDNGIGFNSDYAERIFEVFKRLHGRSAYSGSGIGLAICKRIVDNHNGHIYARSVEGEGSSFIVILPERQTAASPLIDTQL